MIVSIYLFLDIMEQSMFEKDVIASGRIVDASKSGFQLAGFPIGSISSCYSQ